MRSLLLTRVGTGIWLAYLPIVEVVLVSFVVKQWQEILESILDDDEKDDWDDDDYDYIDDEYDLILFLNEYYVVYPKKIPKSEFK